MFGLEQGFMGAGRNLAPIGRHVAEAGSHLDPLGIVGLVLGVLLWAALMTTLVLLMIGLVRHLKSRGTVPAKKGEATKS